MKRVLFWRGFTQIELLLSMGILTILIGILTTVFGQIIDVQLESKAVSSVDQNGRFILSRLLYDMRNATTIVTPATPGTTTNTLTISVDSVDYTYSASSSGDFVLINNQGTNVLNNQAASISGVTFTRIGNGDNNDTIRVNFAVTTRVQQIGDEDQKTFQTTLGID